MKHEKRDKRKGKQAQRLVRRLNNSLVSQKQLIANVDLFEEPQDHKDGYFLKKMKNFYEATKMETSVNHYERELIINGGEKVSPKKQKKQLQRIE